MKRALQIACAALLLVLPGSLAWAQTGDEIAGAILDQAGQELAYLARLVIERVRSREKGQLSLPAVAIAGSILGKIDRVRDALLDSLRARYLEIRFVLEPADPVLGALYHARGTLDQ